MERDPSDPNSPVLLEALIGQVPPVARQVLLQAGDEARRLSHRWVGSAHLAIAVVSMTRAESAGPLPSLPVARTRLEDKLGRGSARESDPLQVTPEALRILEQTQAASSDDTFSVQKMLGIIIS